METVFVFFELCAITFLYVHNEKAHPEYRVGYILILMITDQNLIGEADCLVRAYRSACSAFSALVRVDFVDIALRDSAHGALVNTCTASNAVITNYVSHNNLMFIVNNVLCYAMKQELQISAFPLCMLQR